ncbi:hypothetical protein [Streptomyces antarcticus]|uniref:hypothetical protein n=1 Tax=Streptomyces antarcticus TaxID=2996458 RepID=UPI00226ED8C3|nr:MULTISPECIES: hypothetical protein [unclassified Streptomyces]MCY0942594.1 hypothetical protein [Streptomyces sp. H34-AA3]MCZ4081340.1 hypothetical protein [Streptomyces sp. H34-S5]
MSTPTPTGPTGEQGTPNPAPEQAPAVPPTPTPPPAAPAPGDQDQAATIARLESDLAAARAEAGKGRVTAKQQAADNARAELTAQLIGILDPSKAGQEATPEELTQQLTTAQAQARQTAVELAVYRSATAAGADPDALLDSRQFADSLADVDPADTAAVTAAIKAAITANPRLGAKPTGPHIGGSEFNGAPPQGVTATQFAAMPYAERAELYQTDPAMYRRLAGTQ